jgi:hypothetical protein
MKNMKKAQFGALIKAGAKAAVKKAPRTAKSAFKTKQLKQGLNNAFDKKFPSFEEDLKSAVRNVARKDMKKKFQDIDNGLDKTSSPSEKISNAVKPKPKMKMGGSLKPVDKSKNPGLAKLPTPVRNKMGYQKYGGAVDMMQAGGVVKSQPKRMGPIDPNGAYTKVQERTLAGKKVAAPKLVKDKELGATKMKKGGKVSKKK